ncbi:MAG: class I SAM-dependent methyltransferase [Armatimonadetes bacterium]|nr:class I SAM-dependent methyltransferase [Armatimonadota bacterium]
MGTAASPQELASAYAARDRGAYYDETCAQAERKMARVVQDLAARQLTERALIDVGTGNALLPRRLIEAGFTSVSAHEVVGPEVAMPPGLAKLYRDFDGSSVEDACMEVVTLIDVLEHSAAPREMLSMAHRILKPGGILYIHAPVATRLDRIAFPLHRIPGLKRLARAWQRSRTSVFHLSNFSVAALRQLLAETGFAILECKTINELSWPIERYVRVYLADPTGSSPKVTKLIATILAPVFTSSLLNSNKAVITAERVPGPP